MEAEFNSSQGTAQLIHHGTRYEAQVSEPEPGIFVLVFNHRIYRCSLERLPNGRTEVEVNGRRHPVAVRDPKRYRNGKGSADSNHGRVTLAAPMPGKIVRILLQAGDEVALHQG